MASESDLVDVFTEQLKEISKEEEFVDFKIKCGPETFKVHKVIISSHSAYFRVLCKKFKESETGFVELKAITDGAEGQEECDDPLAIKLMIHFFYNFDYSGPLIGVEPPSASPQVLTAIKKDKEGRPIKRSFWDDFENSQPPDQVDISFTLHARVFAAAVKYQVPNLRALAVAKFKRAANAAWHKDEFCEAVNIVYTTTFDSEKELRDIVAHTILSHPILLDKPEMSAVVQKIEGLSYALLRENVASTVVPSAPCRSCQNLVHGEGPYLTCAHCGAR